MKVGDRVRIVGNYCDKCKDQCGTINRVVSENHVTVHYDNNIGQTHIDYWWSTTDLEVISAVEMSPVEQAAADYCRRELGNV